MEDKRDISEHVITDNTTVSYQVDEEGRQKLVTSTFWQPVNVVNHQAWQEIEKQIEASKRKIRAGRVSFLHYYMTANQMDAGLLAKYTGQSSLSVRLHLIPFFFKRIKPSILSTYADFFNVTPDDLIQGRFKPPIYNQEHGSTSVD